MSLRAIRVAVLSSIVLCASRTLAQNAQSPNNASPGAPGSPNEPSANPDSADTVKPPRLVHAEPAVIPDGESLSESVSVTLALTIDETGRVSAATVLESGGERFDQSALTAVQSFSFEPARRGPTPLAAKIRYRYVFSAESLAAPPSPATPEPEPARVAPTPVTPTPARAPTPEPEEFSAVATIEAPPREATKRTVSGEMLTEMPGTRGDALRAIEVMPGVGRTSLNNGDPILRGAGQDESQTYLNGVPVPFLYHFGGLTSFFSSRDVERIDLYPGNFSTRYGRVSGGVIEVRSKDPRTDGLHAGFDLNLVDSSAFVSSSVGPKASFSLAARRSNIDLVFSKLVPKDAYAVVAAPVYYDYQAIGAYRVNAQNTLRVIGYGSRDSLKLLFANPNDDDPSLSGSLSGTLAFHRVQVELDSKLGDTTHQNLSVTVGRLSASQHSGGFEQTVSGTELHARSEWHAEFLPELGVTAGADFYGQFLGGRYYGPAPEQFEGNPSDSDSTLTRRNVSLILPSFDIVRPGTYLELGMRPARRLLLVPGVRADYYGDVNHFSFDPRLTARYEVQSGFTLKSGIGYYTQAPLYWQALPSVGNPRIEPYRALQISFGFEAKPAETFKFGAEGFVKRLENRIVGTPGGVPPRFVNDGEGRIYGAELSAEYHPGPGTFAYVAYTLSRSERKDGQGPYRLFDHDEPHVLSIAASQNLGRGWTLGGRFRLISGDPRTAVVGRVYDARTGIYIPKYGAVNSERDPAFQQLDIRVEKKWKVGPGSVAGYIDVLNAYNAKNRQGYHYSFDFSRKEPDFGLGFFPNLGIKGEL